MRYPACVVASALVPFATSSEARALFPTGVPVNIEDLQSPSPAATVSKRSKIEWETADQNCSDSNPDGGSNSNPSSFTAVNEPLLPPSPLLENTQYVVEPVSKVGNEYKLVPVSRASVIEDKKNTVATKGTKATEDVVPKDAGVHNKHAPPSNTQQKSEKHATGTNRKVAVMKGKPLTQTVYEIQPASSSSNSTEIVYEIKPVSRAALEGQSEHNNDTSVGDKDISETAPNASLTRVAKDKTKSTASSLSRITMESEHTIPANTSASLTRMSITKKTKDAKETSIPDARADLLSAIQNYRAAISQGEPEPDSNATDATSSAGGGTSRAVDNLPTLNNTDSNQSGNSTMSRAVMVPPPLPVTNTNSSASRAVENPVATINSTLSPANSTA